ncbi:MAG TPA: biotin/lipoyl-containing protein [Ktedonobacteraceae bacterium]|nr:biotin/lipoyl-containing protein [Ktedonobacteraceae bacterium]
MKTDERKVAWLERVEELINVLEGSTISELELSEAGTEIIIRRRPGMVMVNVPMQQGVAVQSGGTGARESGERGVGGRVVKEDHSVAVVAPLTGVYYSAPSPASPPFVSPGDMIYAGQVVALIEAMKVFNEIQSEVSGRVVALVGPTGEVVQKGDVLIRVEPV